VSRSVSSQELSARTVFRRDLVADEAAFLDTRIPGSDRKVNYPLIGPGVSENAAQVIPVTEPHGFNLGAAVMPAGVVNNLHLHFTAEVFCCFAGEWRFRWGVHGDEGEALVRAGDVISIPTWMFRGFTSLSDDAWLFTALGRDVSGGLIWAPSVIEEAARYGMHLGADNRLIETAPGEVPEGVELARPLTDEQLGLLRHVTVEEMRERLATPQDLRWCEEPFLDSRLPGGGARLALVVGYGLTEDRAQSPRVSDPHGFSLAWLHAEPGRGVSRHAIDESQVLIVKEGTLRVTLNQDDPVSTELGPYDTLSIPPGAWRSFTAVGEGAARVVVLTGGDGRVRIDWDPSVVAEALAAGVAIDANGYAAPAALVAR
jgi:quercetin dioxygenase-like cupin family protein